MELGLLKDRKEQPELPLYTQPVLCPLIGNIPISPHLDMWGSFVADLALGASSLLPPPANALLHLEWWSDTLSWGEQYRLEPLYFLELKCSCVMHFLKRKTCLLLRIQEFMQVIASHTSQQSCRQASRFNKCPAKPEFIKTWFQFEGIMTPFGIISGPVLAGTNTSFLLTWKNVLVIVF